MFFSEAKNQKTFACAVAYSPEAIHAMEESLLLLFFRKEGLPYPFLECRRPMRFTPVSTWRRVHKFCLPARQ